VTLFETLGDILRELDEDARPVPLLLPGVSDGRFFARRGIQTYGFLPMQLPEEMRFMELVHGENERIPVHALEFGTVAIRNLLDRLADAVRPRPGPDRRVTDLQDRRNRCSPSVGRFDS
jgi:acetylornithine deacetylase/succinyl-diaminopimelate desuccinylase-like protein